MKSAGFFPIVEGSVCGVWKVLTFLQALALLPFPPLQATPQAILP